MLPCQELTPFQSTLLILSSIPRQTVRNMSKVPTNIKQRDSERLSPRGTVKTINHPAKEEQMIKLTHQTSSHVHGREGFACWPLADDNLIVSTHTTVGRVCPILFKTVPK